MIADLMPTWLWRLLKMDAAALPTEKWTWRHTCRYGRDPARIMQDEQAYRQRLARSRRQSQ